MKPAEKFQNLLRELFEFESADLDFGIYRIMNHKRQVIERWIQEDLPQAIREELQRGALAEQQQVQQALEEARQRVLEALGEDAIDAEGNLAEQYHNTKVGKEYMEARERAAHAQHSEAVEVAVYNHLYTFFSRYWRDGDFISKRRYSKKERYAIPYNGEEVYLYWANHDQYYVKTAEHFSDYTWKAPNGVTVHFKLQQADVEQNNVKGEKRFFLPVLDGLEWNTDTRTLTVPFHYRPLTEQEEITYGKQKQQEKIIEAVLQAIPKRLKGNTEALAALTAERRVDAKGNPVSYLTHHLRQYTARNTRDFFIHKDLRGFLSRELDFYLKNEVLKLEELEAAGEGLSEGWLQLIRLIKRIGNHIIDFLPQIEDFQKMLWEKKKFVTESFYVITVGNIPEDFYPEIAQNEAQWEEWKEMLRLDALPRDFLSGDWKTQEGRVAFLKAHPSLPLDTRHFPPDFTDRLLASFENLDEAADGLLLHSENWQALNLLQEKYRERVKTIYIDPPYNTGNDEFLYRDNYQHSSWMSMFGNRLAMAKLLFDPQGAMFIHIDNNEQARLRILGEDVLGYQSFNAMIAWKNKYGPGAATRGIGDLHEHIMVFCNDPTITLTAPLDEETVAKYSGRDAKFATRGGYVTQPLATRSKDPRPNLVYTIIYEGQEIWPDKQWIWSRERTEAAIANDEVVFNRQPDGSFSVRFKQYLRDEHGRIRRGKPLSILLGPFNQDGTKEIENLFGDRVFSFPKPAVLGQRLVAIEANEWRSPPTVLDYFAGSGTTGHAVINLNREDGGRRKFILVEMGEYFDTVLLPRLKKVTFSPEWKAGKPKRTATQEEFERGPRVMKVLRLESYEDALNNIAFDEEAGQQALSLFGDEYLLRYMLRWESKKSETLLDVEKLQSPFSYQLRIHRDGETRLRPVDLPETFAYLIGLDVETRCVCHDGDRRYLVYRGTTRDGRKVAVLWRDIRDWTQEDFERERAFVAQHIPLDGVDDIYVNGDSFVPGARSLDGIFKARMCGGVEA